MPLGGVHPSGQIAGKLGRLFIQSGTAGEVELTIDEQTIDPQTDDIPDKSSSARGRSRHDGGFTLVKYTAKGFWDADQNMHQDPVFIRGGMKVSAEAWLTDDGVLKFKFPSLYLEDVSVNLVSEKRWEYELSGYGDGDLYWPGEVIP